MKFKPTVSVGNHWLCQAPYGRPNVRSKTGQRWSWGSVQHGGDVKEKCINRILPNQCNMHATQEGLIGKGAVSADGGRKWGKGKERLVECVGGGGGVQLKTDVEVAWQGLFLFIARLLSRVTVLSSLPSTKVMPLPAVHMTQWMRHNCWSRRRSSGSVLKVRTSLHSIHTTFKWHFWVNRRWTSIFPPLFATYSEAAAAF